MKLNELEATKIILSVLGERGPLKSEDELAKILKQRLTKKEMKAMNACVLNADKSKVATELNADDDKFDKIVATASKKLKNEAVHKEFYMVLQSKPKAITPTE